MPIISIGELIDRSWDHYKRDFVDLLSVSGWVLITAIFEITAFFLYPYASKLASTAALTTSEAVGVILYAFSSWVVTPILGLWTFIALTRLIRAQLSNKRSNIREAMLDGKRYFLKTLLVTIFIFGILVAALGIGLGPGILVTLINLTFNIPTLGIVSSILLVVGLVISIVLGFRWSVHYYFAPYALLLDGVEGKAAVLASNTLTKGHFWSILLRLVVPKIVFILMAIMAMVIIGFIFETFLSIFTGLNIDLHVRLSTIFTTILSTVAAVFLNPLLVTADLLLYQSLKR